MAETSHLAPAPLTIRPPRHRVDRSFILWRTLQATFWAIGVLGGLGLLYALLEPARPWLAVPLATLGVTYAVNITIMPTWRYRVHRWETTDEAVYSLSGWITRQWRIIPISRIQSIDTEIGLIQRFLGLATITVTTASGEGKIAIEGLAVAVAEEAVDRLKRITAATPGDAT
jgi:membrane protein YdbS with pleckstrin-like domain